MNENQSCQSLKVAFVGAGNLATNLARAMYQSGFHICQVFSRTMESARVLAEIVHAEPVVRLDELRTDADLYIVALKDACLQSLIPQIVEGKDAHALFVHTAGSLPMDVWAGHAQHYGVFYPMMTFSKSRSVDFNQISFFVEASQQLDTELLKRVAGELSDKVYEANSEQRKYLHLAAVFANNFSNHMYTLAAELLARENLPFDVMLPLIDETSRKVHELSPAQAQTGPAVRYDENVIQNHLDMLKDDEMMHHIYKCVSESIHRHQS